VIQQIIQPGKKLLNYQEYISYKACCKIANKKLLPYDKGALGCMLHRNADLSGCHYNLFLMAWSQSI
jgi:hypothetical protein